MAVPPQKAQPPPNQGPKAVNEFKVVIPESKEPLRYSILQFNGPLNIDPAKWTSSELRMFREDNRAHAVGTTAIVQDYGEGSEYGRAAREEARRKKYGRQSRKYQHDRQPWQMYIKDPTKEPQERRFRSVCEGGAGEHSDYWIFSKRGDSFEAHKVDDWYRFMPTARHKTLDIDQAEEQFQLRNKVLNQFALKAKIQQTLKDADEDNGLITKPSGLKIKDAGSDSEDEGGDKEDSKVLDADAEVQKNGKKKKGGKGKKDKRTRVENSDDVARYESEDGEDEGREYDYMSDSGSDTSREEENLDEKLDKEMVAVGDETGMRDSSEEEDEDEENGEKNEAKEKLMKKLKEQNEEKDEDQTMRVVDQVDERDSSGSDSDDPDNPTVKTSVLFMQKKRKRASDETDKGDSSEAKKAKTESPENTPAKPPEPTTSTASAPPPPTAPAAAQSAPVDRLDDETVRRLLLRKPHTTKELLNKIRPHCGDMSKHDIVARLADILRNIEPQQFRQSVNRKEVLFFSLKPPQ